MITRFQKTLYEHSIPIISQGIGFIQSSSAELQICSSLRNGFQHQDGIAHLYPSDQMIIATTGWLNYEKRVAPV